MNKRGLSLVELLVVLGIIAIISATVIPTAAFYYKRPNHDLAVRELFTMMKAAQVYAATYNVNCGIAFNVRDYDVDGEIVFGMTETMSIRSLKQDELTRLRTVVPANQMPNASAGLSALYVPVAGDSLRIIKGEAMIAGESFVSHKTQVLALDANGKPIPEDPNCMDDCAYVTIAIPDLVSDTGLTRVRVINYIDPATGAIEYIEVSGLSEMAGVTRNALTNHLPACIWKPDGTMLVSDSFAKNRVLMRVASQPDKEQVAESQIEVNIVTGRLRVVH